MLKQMKKSIKLLLIIGMLLITPILFAKTIVNWKALPVTKFWTRNAIKQEDGKKHFYYRPNRFEKMPIAINGMQTLILKTVCKKKTDTVKVTVSIDGQSKDYDIPFTHSDNQYHYYKGIDIKVPVGSKEMTVFTRNPWAYFRAYAKITKEIKPVKITLKANTYKRKVNLASTKSNREYFIGDKTSSIVYTAPKNGKIKALIRFLPLANKKPCIVEIYVNGELKQRLEMKQKLSGLYKVNEVKVSVGKIYLLSQVKKNDKIEIKTISNHEVLTRWYLTTE